MRRRCDRPIYVIAPSLYEAHRTAVQWGLDPRSEGVRAITRAYALRGTTPGTAFITLDRGHWGATREGYELDQAVDLLQRTGRLRPAGEDDIEAVKEVLACAH